MYAKNIKEKEQVLRSIPSFGPPKKFDTKLHCVNLALCLCTNVLTIPFVTNRLTHLSHTNLVCLLLQTISSYDNLPAQY